jgi:ABC-2 type transport system ATP-binding protein
MRDVEALCSRVLVITHGQVVYDGPLADITGQFGRHKIVRLQFAEESPEDDWGRFGEVTRKAGPGVDLRVDRGRVSEVLAAILDRHTVLDISVQDPPLDQVIAHVFEQNRREAAHESR